MRPVCLLLSSAVFVSFAVPAGLSRCAWRPCSLSLAQPSGSLFLSSQRFSVSVQCFAVLPLLRAWLSLKECVRRHRALSVFVARTLDQSVAPDHGVVKVLDARASACSCLCCDICLLVVVCFPSWAGSMSSARQCDGGVGIGLRASMPRLFVCGLSASVPVGTSSMSRFLGAPDCLRRFVLLRSF